MDLIHDNLVKDGGGGAPKSFINQIYNNYIKDKNVDIIVEIGVYNGCFLLPITYLNNNKKTYGIDPYSAYIQKDINNLSLKKLADSISGSQAILDSIYSRLLNNIKQFNLNVEMYRDYAENVYNNFLDNSIDILRIDGNHDTDYVMKDLSLYINKLKINGIVLMDDTDWDSVNSAMNAFLSIHTNVILEQRGNEFCILRKKY
jgi:tRNA G46 methylase TrmB